MSLQIQQQQAKWFGKLLMTVPLTIGYLINFPLICSAQIVPDNTLPNNSVALPDAAIENLINITGGTKAGDNLFHSFEQFSVLNGNTAFFNNALDIENIITRVTGGSISNIDGLISSLGDANLFLINPNGIVFTENAALDIGGSFFASTADSIQFADGSFFSAVNPQSTPLLTVSIPVGLQYGINPGEIKVEGTGNQIFFDFESFVNVYENRPEGLAVSAGETLALVGGNVTLEGGNVTAEQGNIEIGSVKEGTVKLDSTDGVWTLDYQDIENFQDINVVAAASASASGNGGGDINLQGNSIAVADGSAIVANTTGDGDGGEVTINSAEALEVVGLKFEPPLSTSVVVEVEPGATGRGGNIAINTPSLIVADGGQISASTFGLGDGGNLTVKADTVEVIGGGAFGPSGIFAFTDFETGNAGSLEIETNSLSVFDGGIVSTNSYFGSGDGGNLSIKAQEVEVSGAALVEHNEDGSEFEEFPGGIQTGTFSLGNGGNLQLETDNLTVIDGGQIQSTNQNFSLGNAGNIEIDAENIKVSGRSLRGTVGSGIFANLGLDAEGNGGQVNIQTNTLEVLQGGNIASNNDGFGDGGSIFVDASEITVLGESLTGLPSAISADALWQGSGGSIEIKTNSLQVADGGLLGVSTFNSGNGGHLTVEADKIELSGFTEGGRSGLFSSAVNGGNGDGGTIAVTADRLTIKDGAIISASNFFSNNPDGEPGFGRAGNIELNVDRLELDSSIENNASSITASTLDSGGGDIVLKTNLFTASNNSQITAETLGEGFGGAITVETQNLNLNSGAAFSSSTSGAGDAGTIEISASKIDAKGENTGIFGQTLTELSGDAGSIALSADTIKISQQATISTETVGSGDGGTIALNSNSLQILSQGEITTSSIGTGQAGNIEIDSNTIQTNRGSITATSEKTGGGEITIDSEFMRLQNNSSISTSVLDSNGGGGNIDINTNTLLASNNSDIRANAVEGPGGNISISTEVIFTSPSSDIDASSQFGIDGVVEINNPDTEKQFGVTQLPTKIVNPNEMIFAQCPVRKENILVVTGKGGLPSNPQNYLSGETIWQDTRIMNTFKQKSPKSQIDREISSSTIVEANQWKINSSDRVELIVNNRSQKQGHFAVPFVECFSHN